MKSKFACRIVSLFLVLSCLLGSLSACNLGPTLDITSNSSKAEEYCWYDADGTLLHKERFETEVDCNHFPLPSDNDQWDYIEWVEDSSKNGFVADRTPQVSYFVGNVFQIIAKDLGETPVATGSAFVFNRDGWFVTNAHVMQDAYYAQAIFNIENDAAGESFTYLDINQGTYYHLDKDIYIGKIENYSTIQSFYKDIPLNTNYEMDETTYSVGYPLSATELAINKGNVTERWSDLYEKLYSGHTYICSSSYIAPGSSGGILVNAKLEVIGITTLGWTDDDDEFISGASISAFNFKGLLQNNTNKNALISLQKRFHANEKVFIGYFNEAKDDALKGDTVRKVFDNGTVAYVYNWTGEDTSSSGTALMTNESFTIGCDGWMDYEGEYYWANGDRRIVSFYGYYDHEDGFANFIYQFKYSWGDGDHYTLTSKNINYSPNISLTLNKYVVDSSYGYYPASDNIDYAKEQFNIIYEWLTEDMARFQ